MDEIKIGSLTNSQGKALIGKAWGLAGLAVGTSLNLKVIDLTYAAFDKGTLSLNTGLAFQFAVAAMTLFGILTWIVSANWIANSYEDGRRSVNVTYFAGHIVTGFAIASTVMAYIKLAQAMGIALLF